MFCLDTKKVVQSGELLAAAVAIKYNVHFWIREPELTKVLWLQEFLTKAGKVHNV